MVTRFEFATAARILFGEGTARELGQAARELGSRALLVTGATPERVAWARESIECVVYPVAGEPTLEAVRGGARLARSEGCDVVIAAGGGSAIDAGKAIAALATNSGEPLDYLEVVGRGGAIGHAPLPFIAVPTTAGTGAEVTRNAVLQSEEHRVKASMRSARMLPRIAIVDPELTWPLPPALTASTGLDALTQLIEPLVSSRAHPLTDAFCLDGIARAARALPRAFADGADREARREMALASLYGGLALANAGLGAVHGFAAPIGGMWTAPHGAVCAALLPHGIEANIRALRARAPEHESLEKYRKVAQILTGDADAIPEDAVDWVRSLVQRLQIPPLRAWGIGEANVDWIVEKAAQASSMKANPVVLEAGELTAMLRAAI